MKLFLPSHIKLKFDLDHDLAHMMVTPHLSDVCEIYVIYLYDKRYINKIYYMHNFRRTNIYVFHEKFWR